MELLKKRGKMNVGYSVLLTSLRSLKGLGTKGHRECKVFIRKGRKRREPSPSNVETDVSGASRDTVKKEHMHPMWKPRRKAGGKGRVGRKKTI